MFVRQCSVAWAITDWHRRVIVSLSVVQFCRKCVFFDIVKWDTVTFLIVISCFQCSRLCYTVDEFHKMMMLLVEDDIFFHTTKELLVSWQKYFCFYRLRNQNRLWEWQAIQVATDAVPGGILRSQSYVLVSRNDRLKLVSLTFQMTLRWHVSSYISLCAEFGLMGVDGVGGLTPNYIFDPFSLLMGLTITCINETPLNECNDRHFRYLLHQK